MRAPPADASSAAPHRPAPVVRLGTQGWNYAAWVGPFYPTGTRPADFLATYARAFGTVEVDSTFYAVPAERAVLGWAERTPADFRFALKLPQAVTHESRLRGADDVLEAFFDRARLLGPKLGPVLVQLGPDFGPDELPALVRFLPKLPDDVQVAIEFRQRGWLTEGVLNLLADHGVAPALSDGKWVPRRWMLSLADRFAARPPAPFAYVRWMGPNRDLVDYSRIQVDRSRELGLWAQAVAAMTQAAAGVREVYGYVNNHWAGHSPASTRELQRLLGQRPVDPDALGDQLSLL
jgi:uncharacterized protein YecE (DUF72 family)